MLDVKKLMEGLAGCRPVFHSEADFQHALAWCIHSELPGCGVRLEYKPIPKEPMYIDLWVPQIRVAVELKYRTKKLEVEVGDESFSLRNQAAVPLGRYDFLRDVQRLEKLPACDGGESSFAVLLTNDALYWKQARKSDPVDGAFHLYEGRRISGEMAWSGRAGDGTKKGREQPIRLHGTYALRWCDFAIVGDGPCSQFRYLAVRVSG